MYFKVNTSDPCRAQIWMKRMDGHPLKTASLLIFLNSSLRLLAGGSFKDDLQVSLPTFYYIKTYFTG